MSRPEAIPSPQPTPTPQPALHIVFDGRELPARPGQSVGAALVEAGITAWRTTRRHGRPRGLFCGIGVCYDCLLTVAGRANQRACLTPVCDGLQVERG